MIIQSNVLEFGFAIGLLTLSPFYLILWYLDYLLISHNYSMLYGNWKLKHGDDHASCCEICIKNVNLLPANN